MAVPGAEVLVEFASGEFYVGVGREKLAISEGAGTHGFVDSQRQLTSSPHVRTACESLRDVLSMWRLGLGPPMPWCDSDLKFVPRGTIRWPAQERDEEL